MYNKIDDHTIMLGIREYKQLLKYTQRKNLKEETRTRKYQKLNQLEDAIEYLIPIVKNKRIIENWKTAKEERMCIIK